MSTPLISAPDGASRSITPVLTILDQLAVPEMAADLELQLTDWRECCMFFPIEGQPRAYHEVPFDWRGHSEFGEPQHKTVRWLYTVYGATMPEVTARVAEKALCGILWRYFVDLRKAYELRYPEGQPTLVWRRHVEFSHDAARKSRSPRESKLTLRLCIPGLEDLATQSPLACKDSHTLISIDKEGNYVPRQ